MAKKNTLDDALIGYKKAKKLLDNNEINEATLILKQLTIAYRQWEPPWFALIELTLSKRITADNREVEIWMKWLDHSSRKNNVIALYLKSLNAENKKEIIKAQNLLRKCLELQPRFTPAAERLATLYLQSDNWADAEQILLKQIDNNPKGAHLLNNLSVALLRQNKLEEAQQFAEKALEIALHEQLASIHVNLGTILQERGLRKEASTHYSAALSQEPEHVNATMNLGVIALQEKHLIEAEKFFRKTLALQPENIHAGVNLAGVLLIQGQFEEGWSYYESRLKEHSKIINKPNNLHQWTGKSLKGSLILVHEQGLGDTFQFIRFAAKLQEQNQHCIFRGPEKLHGIIKKSGLVIECIGENDPIPEVAEAWTPLMSLPRLLQHSLPNPFEEKSPYFKSEPKKLTKWSGILEKKKTIRVALHWQGNPDHEFTISRGRSFKLEILLPLFNLEDVEWIHLQKGSGSEQAITTTHKIQWHPNQAKINTSWDFEDNAAILQCCDLLISSDSGLAHLAGGLGINVWLMLPWLPEWRWGLEGSTTPWYKNHRLYRQQQEGNWNSVVNEIRDDLIKYISNKKLLFKQRPNKSQ